MFSPIGKSIVKAPKILSTKAVKFARMPSSWIFSGFRADWILSINVVIVPLIPDKDCADPSNKPCI